MTWLIFGLSFFTPCSVLLCWEIALELSRDSLSLNFVSSILILMSSSCLLLFFVLIWAGFFVLGIKVHSSTSFSLLCTILLDFLSLYSFPLLSSKSNRGVLLKFLFLLISIVFESSSIFGLNDPVSSIVSLE